MNWRCWWQVPYSTLLVITCLGGVDNALSKQKSISPACLNVDCNELTQQQLQRIANAITVKVLGKNFLGSGTLLRKQRGIYTVITNAHVLRSSKPPYKIQTPDGRIYQSATIKTVRWDGNDLSLLQFHSDGAVYLVASVGNSSTLAVRDKVFVGGFTSNSDQQQSLGSLVFTVGDVSLLLDKALEGGYKIAYTNDIRKGMSGAAVLNIRGQVVGINGLHKDPVWNTPDLYQDGSQPSQPLQQLITRSSLAIPINKVVDLAPNFISSQATH